MPATVLFLECKSYVIVGIYTSISEFQLMCGDVRFSGTPVHFKVFCPSLTYIYCMFTFLLGILSNCHKYNCSLNALCVVVM